MVVARTLAVAALLASPLAPREVLSPEYKVKAHYLCNFARFVDWPPQATPPPGSPLRVCVVGEDPFGPLLPRAVHGRTVRDRPLVAHHPAEAELDGCHVLFVSAAEEQKLPRLLAALGDAPVLTVGETEGFARAGGMITFRMVDRRVRFEINAEAASQAGLRISAQLLKLATRVTR